MPKLIEPDCRRPDWAPGAEVVLSDGQVWHFPRPRLVYRIQIDPVSRAPVFKTDSTRQSPTYGALLDQLDSTTADVSWFTLLATLALELLRAQYDIADDAVPDLFVFDPGSKVSLHRWELLHQAVLGVAVYPKA